MENQKFDTLTDKEKIDVLRNIVYSLLIDAEDTRGMTVKLMQHSHGASGIVIPINPQHYGNKIGYRMHREQLD